jgi:hypothetical protein
VYPNPGIAERVWYQSHVPIFLEKVVLPVLVTVGAAVLTVNPMKYDWQSRISLFVALLAFGYFVSHQLHLRNEVIRTGTVPAATQQQGTTTNQNATDCSQNFAGNGNKGSVNCDDKSEK